MSRFPFKKFIQNKLNGYYYAIISNILRSTILPYTANKKKYFEINNNFFHPEITIDTIGLCNARCKFCSYRISDRPKEILSIEKFKLWASSAYDLGFKRLNLTPINGEFFLNKNYGEIINYSRKIGYKKVRTFTNAVNFSKINLDQIFDEKLGLTSISISTGGFMKETYEDCFGIKKYEQFLEGLLKILEYFDNKKPNIALSVELRSNKSVKDNLNSSDFKKYLKKYYDNKIFNLEHINYFDSWAGQVKQRDLPKGMVIGPKPIIQKRHCHRLYTLGILYDGVVRLCNCRYQGGNIEEDGLYLGNLNNSNLREILNLKIIKDIRDGFSKLTPNVCKNCQFYIPTILK